MKTFIIFDVSVYKYTDTPYEMPKIRQKISIDFGEVEFDPKDREFHELTIDFNESHQINVMAGTALTIEHDGELVYANVEIFSEGKNISSNSVYLLIGRTIIINVDCEKRGIWIEACLSFKPRLAV